MFSLIQRLRAALHAACGKICEQIQTQSNVSVDKKVVAAIGDVTFQQIGIFCQDLEAFAKYGENVFIMRLIVFLDTENEQQSMVMMYNYSAVVIPVF